MQRQRHFRKFTATASAVIRVLPNQFSCDRQTDVFLRLPRRAADMRRQDHVIVNPHSGEVNGSLLRPVPSEDVDSRPCQMFRRQQTHKAGISTTVPRGGVNRAANPASSGLSLCAHHVLVEARYVQTDHTLIFSNSRQVLHLSCITERQFISIS